MNTFIRDARKFLVTLVSIAGVIVANNSVHGSALRWTTFAIAVANAILVYAIPNGPSSDPTTSTTDV